jgi:hypothetical protein
VVKLSRASVQQNTVAKGLSSVFNRIAPQTKMARRYFLQFDAEQLAKLRAKRPPPLAHVPFGQ